MKKQTVHALLTLPSLMTLWSGASGNLSSAPMADRVQQGNSGDDVKALLASDITNLMSDRINGMERSSPCQPRPTTSSGNGCN